MGVSSTVEGKLVWKPDASLDSEYDMHLHEGVEVCLSLIQ